MPAPSALPIIAAIAVWPAYAFYMLPKFCLLIAWSAWNFYKKSCTEVPWYIWVYMATQLASACVASTPFLAFNGIYRDHMIGLAPDCLFVCLFMLCRGGYREQLKRGIVIAGVISAVIAMTIFPHGRDFGWRIYGFIGQPNYLGTFLAMAILVALGTHSKYRNFDKFIAIPIMLYALAWTGSRSSILGLAIGFCFMNREYAKHILLAGILAVGVTGYMRGASQMSDISRVATFRAAMAGVSHTILLGHGPASFIHVLHLHDDGTWRASRPGAVMQIHAHNPFLEAMSSSGLLGLIAFTLLCLYLGEVVLQDEDAAIQGAIAAACVAAQFNPIGLPAKALLCALVGTCMPESIGPRWQKLLIIPAIISAVIWLIVDLRGLGII